MVGYLAERVLSWHDVYDIPYAVFFAVLHSGHILFRDRSENDWRTLCRRCQFKNGGYGYLLKVSQPVDVIIL